MESGISIPGSGLIPRHARLGLEYFHRVERRVGQLLSDRLVDVLGYALGARVVVELKDVVQERMVEAFEHRAEGAFEFAEVEEHAALPERLALGPDADFIVVAVEALALASIPRQEMGGRKIGLDASVIHGYR